MGKIDLLDKSRTASTGSGSLMSLNQLQSYSQDENDIKQN